MELFDNIMLGLSTALAWNNLLWCIIGVSLGTLIGVIPGVGTLATMSLLFPITYVLEPTAALIMLAGIWYGSTYGGSTASILLNLPGTPANAVTCLDGFPMAKQGRGGVALLMTTVASFFGASVGIVMMMLFSPLVAEVAFKFGPAEYFSIMALGLVAASVVSSGSAIKGITMVVGGVMLGLVGTDVNSGVARFDFGFPELQDGVQIVALAMGLLAIRTRGIYFAMVTLALSQCVYFLVYQLPASGGENGLRGVNVAEVSLLGLRLDLLDPMQKYYFILGFVALAMAVLSRILSSPFGGVVEAIRENGPQQTADLRAVGRVLRPGRRAQRDPPVQRGDRDPGLYDLGHGRHALPAGRDGHLFRAVRGRGPVSLHPGRRIRIHRELAALRRSGVRDLRAVLPQGRVGHRAGKDRP